jgi:hypothetical protein
MASANRRMSCASVKFSLVVPTVRTPPKNRRRGVPEAHEVISEYRIDLCQVAVPKYNVFGLNGEELANLVKQVLQTCKFTTI